MTEPAALRDVVVIGGGCYGTFYASQLAKAKRHGKTAYRRVIVVDRNPDCRARRELGEASDRAFALADWDEFGDTMLKRAAEAEAGAEGDVIVPSPHMPHLMFAWIVRRARRQWPQRSIAVVPLGGTLGTPYERSAADGTRYVSFADWVCPTHCIEPARCPAIRAPRTWEMDEAVRNWADRVRASGEALHGPALFVCRHHVFGVGTFSVDAVLAGDRLVATAGADPAGARVLIGTISSCHGALNLLEVGPLPAGVVSCEGPPGVLREPRSVM